MDDGFGIFTALTTAEHPPLLLSARSFLARIWQTLAISEAPVEKS